MLVMIFIFITLGAAIIRINLVYQ